MFKSSQTKVDVEELSAFLPTGKEESVDTPELSDGLSLRHPRQHRPELPWVISTCILAILLPVVVFVRLPTWPEKRIDQEIASTELPALQQSVEYEYQQYTGMLTFNETSRQMIRLKDADIDFFGPPTDELDETWEILLHDEFPVLMDNEVPAGVSESNRMPDDKFHFEPDFFHNLHCVNEIRKQMSRVLYPDIPLSTKQQQAWDDVMEKLGPEWNVIHIEHCLDRIRQALSCAADLTPSVMHRWDNYFLAVGQTGPRKCRKFEPIRQWMDERNAAFSSAGKV